MVDLLKKYWGYDSFRPLQKEAVTAICEGRDALVVLPTGGGKSLCYQIPALIREGTALVVSPLISLMKDQVDSMNDSGISAVRLDSSLGADEYRSALSMIYGGQVSLIYISPERLVSESFMETLSTLTISLIAVDEAHCVSMWGHDFRPEYRQIQRIRELFPHIPLGAFTATATGAVRDDISKQLQLRTPEVLVGSFDRPNLVYRVLPRNGLKDQIEQVLSRHKDESGIIYCISRKETEKQAETLIKKGYKAACYHAGLGSAKRQQVQESFQRDEIRIITATVAFGMGIDISHIRFVIHAAMPQSLEHYQQETGRAGRDGMEAECVLFYSGRDLMVWKSILEKEGTPPPGALDKLNSMYSYSTTPACRHVSLPAYFGETITSYSDGCGSCDVCLGELPQEENSLILSQKILSCVARLKEGFGADYTADVLAGSKTQRITDRGHKELSTYGLLKEEGKKPIRQWIEQLAGGGYLEKQGEYNLLKLTPLAWEVMRGERSPQLYRLEKKKAPSVSRAARESWEGVDRDLFEKLRDLRRDLAIEANLPAFVIFSDATLRDMARLKPQNREDFLLVSGVGESKREKYGESFLRLLNE